MCFRGECLLQERDTAQEGLWTLMMGLKEDGFEVESCVVFCLFFFDGPCTYPI